MLSVSILSLIFTITSLIFPFVTNMERLIYNYLNHPIIWNFLIVKTTQKPSFVEIHLLDNNNNNFPPYFRTV